MNEKWSGHYVYGDGYGEDLFGKTVAFHIEWTNNDGEITGTCTDEESSHIFDTPSTINGFVDGNIISFIKRYPCYWTSDENGKDIVERDKPAPEIHYSGLLIDGRFEGDWDMSSTFVEKGETFEWHGNGTFTLNRI